MRNNVKQYINQNKLISRNQHIVIGVSGGADSICLFHILKSLQEEYNLKLTVAHINHGMRQEAAEDAAFVEALCVDWGVPYKEHQCHIVQLAKEQKISEEVVGRNERYQFFEKIRLEYNADKIAVAHTMNDQAETMLMRLIRGSGVTGLGAIMAQRDLIIRPLLMVSREDVEQYCHVNGLAFKEDITNKMAIYTRNKLRLQVLPILKKEFNPKIIEAVSQAAAQLQETESYLEIQTKLAYESMAHKYKKGYSIQIEPLLSFHPVIQSRIIRMAIENHVGDLKDINHQNIKDVLSLVEKQSGKSIHIGNQCVAIREHGYIRIINEEKPLAYSRNLALGINKIVECNKKVEMILLDNSKIKQRYQNTYTKNIDYDKISGNLQIRNRQVGDRILLKNGSKKLKDFFIDEKIPKTCRDDIIVIADQSNIIWVVGYRLSEEYYITEQTKHVLQIQINDLLT
ncbi:MAG TPA: tRNA lysidine(34) synthetase TilS [Epulopiscium sp.]|nr:tRNA lysidine(34) synthetase TilS [Candidatus Epulonipiscium sp.]